MQFDTGAGLSRWGSSTFHGEQWTLSQELPATHPAAELLALGLAHTPSASVTLHSSIDARLSDLSTGALQDTRLPVFIL